MLKVISKILATLKLSLKYGVKEALLLELLKENKKLKLELKAQQKLYSKEILMLRGELYDERLYNRHKYDRVVRLHKTNEKPILQPTKECSVGLYT